MPKPRQTCRSNRIYWLALRCAYSDNADVRIEWIGPKAENSKHRVGYRAMGIALCGLILLLTAVHASYAQTSAGSISAIHGKVMLTRTGKTIPAAYGTQIQVGDQMVTEPASNVTVTLADGSQLGLDESSTMVIDENMLNRDGSRAATSINLLGGLLHSIVRHAPGNAPNYVVHTPNAAAAARGTDYDTDYHKDVDDKEHQGCHEYTDVSVREGEVEVTNTQNPGAGSVKLKKGQKTRIRCAAMPLPPSPATIAAIGALGVAGSAAVGIGVYGATGGFSGGEPTTPSQ